MYKAFRIDVLDVLSRPDLFTPCAYNTYEQTAKVELVQTKDCNIPRLHFTWVPEYHIYSLDKETMEKLVAAGFTCETQYKNFGDESPDRWSCFVQGKKEQHLWFMNFRRYGWSWTSDEDGEYGYCDGHVYANGTAVAFLARTPEDVIRDSLVQSWTQLKSSGALPPVFFSQEVEAALRWLFDDAVSNRTEYARPTHNSGPAVSWLPAMRVDLPTLQTEQAARKAVYDYKQRDANVSLFQVPDPMRFLGKR